MQCGLHSSILSGKDLSNFVDDNGTCAVESIMRNNEQRADSGGVGQECRSCWRVWVAIRGKRHIKAVADILGPVPLAGFFCNGEIGPVGSTNYLHGFTASIALFSK